MFNLNTITCFFGTVCCKQINTGLIPVFLFNVDLPGLEPGIQEPESCVLPITPQVNFFANVVRPGFEPEPAGPKPAVLPLHHRTKHFPFGDCKSMYFSQVHDKIFVII